MDERLRHLEERFLQRPKDTDFMARLEALEVKMAEIGKENNVQVQEQNLESRIIDIYDRVHKIEMILEKIIDKESSRDTTHFSTPLKRQPLASVNDSGFQSGAPARSKRRIEDDTTINYIKM